MLQVREINVFGKGELEGLEPGLRGLLFVISGSGSLSISGSAQEMSSGRVFFLEEGGSVGMGANSVISGFLISFENSFLIDFLLHYPWFREIGVFEVLTFVEVSRADVFVLLEELRWLKAEISSEVGLMRLKLRFNLVMLVILDGVSLAFGRQDREEKLRECFIGLLEEHFRVQRTSGFYAGKLGISMRKLNGLCRICFDGKGFSLVHRDRLLCEAEYLLLETDKAVKEIAFELKFCSQQHFRGYFKKLKGISPSAFRKGELAG